MNDDQIKVLDAEQYQRLRGLFLPTPSFPVTTIQADIKLNEVLWELGFIEPVPQKASGRLCDARLATPEGWCCCGLQLGHNGAHEDGYHWYWRSYDINYHRAPEEGA